MTKETVRDQLEAVYTNIDSASLAIKEIAQEALFRTIGPTRSVKDEELHARLAKVLESLSEATDDLEIVIVALTPRKPAQT
jgi:hypothetical protein